MARFRCRNPNLAETPIESGCRRPTNIARNLKVCELCNDLGDEYYFLFICPRFSEARKNTLRGYWFDLRQLYHFIM